MVVTQFGNVDGNMGVQMTDDSIHTALREISGKVGSLTTSVCDMKDSMERGRCEAISRNNALEETIAGVADDVALMKPHVEQFVVVKKRIVQAAAASILASLSLNFDSLLNALKLGR